MWHTQFDFFFKLGDTLFFSNHCQILNSVFQDKFPITNLKEYSWHLFVEYQNKNVYAGDMTPLFFLMREKISLGFVSYNYQETSFNTNQSQTKQLPHLYKW
jgi:hypothetical protein